MEEKPWLCLKDFNKIIFYYENMGGLQRREQRIREFKDYVGRHNIQ